MNENLYSKDIQVRKVAKKKTRLHKLCDRLPQIGYKMSFKNNYRKLFDLVTMCLSIYNALLIPYEISFWRKDDWITLTIDYVIDLVFLIDFLVMFRTTQQDNRGYEEFDNYEMTLIYTQTWRFRFDLLALLGNGVFTMMHPYFKYFKLFKAARVFRLGRLVLKSSLTH